MTQLSKDAAGDGRIDVDAALTRIAALCRPVAGTELVPLGAALGRILAADIVAARNVPPAANSAVDGYAVYFDDLSPDGPTRLPVTGRAAAGHPLPRPARPGEAVRIFTGAPLPAGADGGPGPDTVVMQEDITQEDVVSDACATADIGAARIVVPAGLKRGDNARACGEDVAAGARVLARGHRLRPQDIGVAASLGLTHVELFAPLRVAVFSTGDEVHDPGVEPPPGGIYDANRYCLLALLQGLGAAATDLGILPDDETAIAAALTAAAGGHDLILSSGGVSVGDEDHVRRVVEAHGGIAFWRLNIKPGRPVGMGEIGATPMIALPGNPAAMMVTFLRLARPAILSLAGAAQLAPTLYPVTSGFDHRKKAGRREYVRVRLTRAAGAPVAQKFARTGAGILTSFVEADGLVELAEPVTHLRAGETVDFLPFSEVM